MKYLLFCSLICVAAASFAQQDYWQQEVHYTINVSLDDRAKSLSADLSLEYINHSPDTLTYIWFHLWPNAYRNDKTALAKQLASESSKSKLWETGQGYIDSLNFTVDGSPAKTIPDKADIDIMKLLLPSPLAPGKKIVIKTPFHVKLPPYYSRSGYTAKQFMICQWYPKPAVYDRSGWHPFPYLDQGEFYSEYGTFKVNVTLPSSYVVAATGKMETISEFNTYKNIGTANHKNPESPIYYKAADSTAPKTLSYFGENIHDFAWFAQKDFIVQYDTTQLPSGKTIDVFSYYQPDGNKEWMKSTGFVKDAVQHYSNWIGEYPYLSVAAVEGPSNESSGGMEYPMVTLITSPGADEENLDAVIAHEVGHNWFYSVLGSNERDSPWMDEGINTYFQFRYEAEKYRGNSLFGNSIPEDVKKLSADDFLQAVFNSLNAIPAPEPVATKSTGFSNKDEYGIVVYVKTAIWMYIMESSLGKEDLFRGIKEYYNEWKFRHPYPSDLQSAMEKGSGKQVSELFALLQTKGNFK
jgi:hypothetical protein